ACTNTIRANAGERSRTGMNETETETGDWAAASRGEVIDLWYSGKAHAHGGNIQAVIAPSGFPLWVSEVEPGSVHDITAARIHALPGLYRAAAADLPTLADPGLRRRRPGHPHPGQAAIRRHGTRRQYPHPQCHSALPALPGRTWVCPAHRPLAHSAAHHRKPQQNSETSPAPHSY